MKIFIDFWRFLFYNFRYVFPTNAEIITVIAWCQVIGIYLFILGVSNTAFCIGVFNEETLCKYLNVI